MSLEAAHGFILIDNRRVPCVFPLPQGLDLSPAAVLLFHGLTGSPLEMESLAKPLSDLGLDVFVPCLKGHQRSLEELRVVRAEDWLEQVDELYQWTCNHYQKVFVSGLSFGALLAAYAAESERIPDGLALLSPSLKLRSSRLEFVLQFLSRLPNSLINVLGFKRKIGWDQKKSVVPRESYHSHSIGAVARLVYIRRYVIKRAHCIRAPLLIIQDPRDYHLSNRGVFSFSAAVSSSLVKLRWLPGASHHLSTGEKHQVVSGMVSEFFLARLR